MAAIYKDRDAYEKIKPLVNGSSSSVFSDIDAILYDRAEEYYENDKYAESIDPEVILSYINRTYPKQADMLSIALDRVVATEGISCNNIVQEFLQVKRHAAGQKLAGALLSGKDTTELLHEYNTLSSTENSVKEDDVVIHSNIRSKDISLALDRENVITLYPKDLNDRVEGVMRGDHILIFARPETGKSMVAINMVRGFLEQGLKVLYIGNEDSEQRMLPRFLCSVAGITKQEMEEMGADKLDEILDETPIDNLSFVHLEPGTFPQIRSLIRKVNPDVVVVDQIRNVQTGGDGLTTGLERAGTEMRNIGNEFNVLAVSITQAGESANGKLRLDLSDIDSSKTGLPAQIDLMIGIGVNEDYDGRSKRMISLPKNKISGDHSFFSVDVDEARSRVL